LLLCLLHRLLPLLLLFPVRLTCLLERYPDWLPLLLHRLPHGLCGPLMKLCEDGLEGLRNLLL
jgi:hypothetical protein